MIYEVFRQERKGQAFQHAGSVDAPDEQFAEIYAREQYARRQESVALWLVPRESVHEIPMSPDGTDAKRPHRDAPDEERHRERRTQRSRGE